MKCVYYLKIGYHKTTKNNFSLLKLLFYVCTLKWSKREGEISQITIHYEYKAALLLTKLTL